MPDTKRTLRIVPADSLGHDTGGVPEYRARTSDTERLWASSGTYRRSTRYRASTTASRS